MKFERLTKDLLCGDGVYSPAFGYGYVVSTIYSEDFPILCDFNGERVGFNSYGYMSKNQGSNCVLFKTLKGENKDLISNYFVSNDGVDWKIVKYSYFDISDMYCQKKEKEYKFIVPSNWFRSYDVDLSVNKKYDIFCFGVIASILKIDL